MSGSRRTLPFTRSQFLWRAGTLAGGRAGVTPGAWPGSWAFSRFAALFALRKAPGVGAGWKRHLRHPLHQSRVGGVAKHPRSQAGNIASPGRGSPGCGPSNPTAPEPRESAVSGSPGLLGDRQGTQAGEGGTGGGHHPGHGLCPGLQAAGRSIRQPQDMVAPRRHPALAAPRVLGQVRSRTWGGRQSELPKHPLHPKTSRTPCITWTPHTPCTTGTPCHPTRPGHPRAPQSPVPPTHSKHSMHPTCPG